MTSVNELFTLYLRMSLIKRKPRKAIRITEAAKLIGCSSESIRTGAVGRFTTFKLNPQRRNSPLYCYEAEVMRFLEEVQQ